MTGWVDSIRNDERRQHAFNRERVKEEAAFGIYSLMESQGVSRAELARRIGRNRSFITKVLGGSHNLTIGTLGDLYFALGRALHFAMGDDPTEVQTPGEHHVRGSSEERSIYITFFVGSTDKVVQTRGLGEAGPESAADLGGLHASGVSRGSISGDASILFDNPARPADTA